MGVIVLLALSGCDLGIGHIVVVDDGWDAADTGVADTDAFYFEDTGVPTDRLDTGTPDRPDTGRPDTDRPDTDRPDTGSTDTESPDTGSRDTGSWDTGSPDEEDAPRWCSMDTIRTAPCVDGVAAWNTTTYTRYRLVQSAIDDAVSGDTVAVCAGTWTENLTIPAIELTLRGYGADTTVLDGGGSGTVVLIESGADLELADLAIVNGSESGVSGYSADLLTCGVRFEGNSSHNGGGLALGSGTWTGEDVTFVGNYAEYSGGGASLGTVTTLLAHATFTENDVGYEGGGMHLGSEGSAELWDSRFESNHSEHDGAGIATNGWSTGGDITLNRVVFTDNIAVGGGAAISSEGWSLITFRLNECTFTDNRAGGDGGAVDVGSWGGNTIVSTGSLFSGNTAGTGGAIALGGWGPMTLSLIDTLITGNSATSSAGAIDATGRGDSWVSLTDSTVSNNSAAQGGAFALGGWGLATLTMTNGAVTNNVSGGGGVLAIDQEATVSVTTSDWGTGATDNVPSDAPGYVAGTSATFTCSSGTCY